MPKTPSNSSDLAQFISQLQTDYPNFIFKQGSRFVFRPPRTISFEKPQNSPYPPANFALLALHELAHALLGHQDYHTHIERLKMESAAWQRAKTLALHYQKIFSWLHWDEDFAETELDSYRDWLHTKSLCKNCGLTRFQTPDGKYHCPQCDII